MLAAGLGVPGDAAEAERAAGEWALADLALHLGEGEERDRAMETTRSRPWRPARLPRLLRPLAVLHGLTRRAIARRGDELLDGPGAALLALRIGVSGR